MSKELEFLDKIYFAETNEGRLELFFQYSPAIKKALQRLEAIDNANPSEALECLGKIIDNLDDYADFEIKQEANEYIDTIKQALLKAQKEHKALEIIKEKNVDIRWIEVCDTVKDYNKGRDEHLNYELTEEEFNLLKEILEC